MIIRTHFNNYWYEVDDKNRVFRCTTTYRNKINKVLISSRDTKSQAIKLAEHFATEFNYGVCAAY